MFLDTKAKLVPLTALKDWNVDETGVHCRKEACFDVEYFDIETVSYTHLIKNEIAIL